jgi:hypothetical protein
MVDGIFYLELVTAEIVVRVTFHNCIIGKICQQPGVMVHQPGWMMFAGAVSDC